MNEEILKQILEELKKLNKHFDKIEAEKMGKMIYNSAGARTPVLEKLFDAEELAKKQKHEDWGIKCCWETIKNPFLPKYQKNNAKRKIEELTGKKFSEFENEYMN